VRARVPGAGRSEDFVAPLLLPLRQRAFGFRPFDLALRTRLAAGVLTVKCPFPFMVRCLSSFQASPGERKKPFLEQPAQLKGVNYGNRSEKEHLINTDSLIYIVTARMSNAAAPSAARKKHGNLILGSDGEGHAPRALTPVRLGISVPRRNVSKI
jgi:hypothetical protein